ncbi:MAG: endonuclease MutS2, partial [Ruminococcaceae bacterium]|nr:endonuclease MutS2 [Oscillospiraceae bacterium]
PTYRLLIGIPGKSNAFAISQRLGLPVRVIESAKEQMSGESVRFEDVLSQLELKRQALEKEKEETDRLLLRREEDARKAREFREQMERAKENARSRGEAEAKRILADAKAAADETFRELDALRREQRKLEAQAVNEQRAEILHKLNDAREAVGERDTVREPIPKPSRPIAVGDLVEIPGTGRQAEVLSVQGGTLECRAGSLRMKVKADEVRLIEADERAALAQKKTPAGASRVPPRAAAPRELDIRGMETLEAESVVENYIDSAVMAHLESVTIIHGKGTGALRKAVHALLKRNKHVKSFRLGAFGEGEAGVTVVELR